MTKDYLLVTRETAKYPGVGTGNNSELQYLGLGLASEAGEIAGNIKKMVRDLPGDNDVDRRAKIIDELGDTAWYWTRLCDALGVEPWIVLTQNMRKLADREKRGVIGGDGDNR